MTIHKGNDHRGAVDLYVPQTVIEFAGERASIWNPHGIFHLPPGQERTLLEQEYPGVMYFSKAFAMARNIDPPPVFDFAPMPQDSGLYRLRHNPDVHRLAEHNLMYLGQIGVLSFGEKPEALAQQMVEDYPVSESRKASPVQMALTPIPGFLKLFIADGKSEFFAQIIPSGDYFRISLTNNGLLKRPDSDVDYLVSPTLRGDEDQSKVLHSFMSSYLAVIASALKFSRNNNRSDMARVPHNFAFPINAPDEVAFRYGMKLAWGESGANKKPAFGSNNLVECVTERLIQMSLSGIVDDLYPRGVDGAEPGIDYEVVQRKIEEVKATSREVRKMIIAAEEAVRITRRFNRIDAVITTDRLLDALKLVTAQPQR